MDTDSMSFCYEEHFPTYESSEFFTADDESQSAEEVYNTSDAPYWDWEVEQEINGDIAIIPMSSNVGMNYLSNSPPAREDFQKIMSEWQHFMNSEVSELEAFTSDMTLTDDAIPITDNIPTAKVSRFPGKKIDTTAQCYIIDSDKESVKVEPSTDIELKLEPKDEDLDSESDFIDVDTISDQEGAPILQAGDLNSLLEQFEATETYQPETSPIKVEKTEPEDTTNSKSKQILDALPQELIMKIKASSKRRVVPVIDAIPNKKRTKKAQAEQAQSTPVVATEEVSEKVIKTEHVQFDHDYCSQATPYPKNPQKDSGFQSAEEDEQRSILKKQPTVKGADGKLMVSLLKINTIRNSIATEDNNKIKRKLNLEEYKKRRVGALCAQFDSYTNSSASSGASSPIIAIEDEHTRILKHQQKLMQMAAEVLKTPPKSATVTSTTSVSETATTLAPVVIAPVVIPHLPPRIPPNNIEVKTLVSMGVNTDISSAPLPTTELEEIKPILKSATAKINDNSLITSVIENIQKKKVNNSVIVPQTECKQSKDQEHGEDKTIVYLDKCRSPVLTRNVEIQTEPEAEDTSKHKRKRSCSSSSGEHRKSYKRRSSSNDSRYSYSSQSSSTSSRSRSRSPRRTFSKNRYGTERDHIREVEERRIVYVGGLSSSVSKEALRRRFQVFGSISNISIHFREYGDNYGFVTYMYKADAYKAVEHGNDDPMLPKYDLSFGGRRIFCRSHYADLDNVQDDKLYAVQGDDSFDSLLREAKAKLRKRKTCT